MMHTATPLYRANLRGLPCNHTHNTVTSAPVRDDARQCETFSATCHRCDSPIMCTVYDDGRPTSTVRA